MNGREGKKRIKKIVDYTNERMQCNEVETLVSINDNMIIMISRSRCLGSYEYIYIVYTPIAI